MLGVGWVGLTADRLTDKKSLSLIFVTDWVICLWHQSFPFALFCPQFQPVTIQTTRKSQLDNPFLLPLLFH